MNLRLATLLTATFLVSGQAHAGECGARYFDEMERYEETTPKEVYKGPQGRKFCVHMRKRAAFSETFITWLDANPGCSSDVAASMRRNRSVYRDILNQCDEARL